jgi:hypothetical protein
MRFLDAQKSYTFSKIFELKIQAKDLASDFGFSLTRKRLNLPQYPGELDRLEELKSRIEEVLPYVDLANETTRREMLIARVVSDLIHYTRSEVRIKYPVKVTEQLQGYFDYLMKSERNFLVIEAKQEDLTYGFTQLVAELIALDQWQHDAEQSELLGAVTTGTLWQFGRLDRTMKHIDQGLDSYRVPDDLDPLMRILVKALIG